jgi:hypothetical protein
MRNEENLANKEVRQMRYKKEAKKSYGLRRPKRAGAPKLSGRKPPTGEPSYPKVVSAPTISNDEAFKRDEIAFKKLKQKYVSDERFRGKFIAVLDGKLVDCDEDDRKLAKRVYDCYGYRPIYIGKVTEKRRIVDLPSPELGRK